MLYFHFSEEKNMPVAIFPPTIKISTSLESLFTYNSLSTILLLLLLDVKEFCTELSDTDKILQDILKKEVPYTFRIFFI